MKLIFNSVCALTVLRVLLGIYQLVEAQDECDQKVLHILQGRNFWVAVQLFEDRTGSMQRVEVLLTLILEDISKNVIKDCRVETCLAVGSWHLRIQS